MKKFFTKFSKVLDHKSLKPFYKIFLSSLLIISFFYLMPIAINYSKNKNFVFENNSKEILAYTLNNDGNNLENDDEAYLDENDLLKDIFSLNDLETDTVRLNASTIKQLFEDTNYSLKDVREKLVKPVALTLLPAEIRMIENTKQRKDFSFKLYYH